MKTVLVVEDEKLIRQGIKNMIQKSKVPVDIVIECNNGEAALEILKSQKVDLMFTDIRMPKMDGIELVKEVQKLDEKPLIVVLSGYDDFSYAVEMLRNGVKEYILKPVDREQIANILSKCNEEIEKKENEEKTRRKLNLQQLKYLCMTPGLSEAEKQTIYSQCKDDFFQNEYIVCCCNCQIEEEEQNQVCIYLGRVGEHDIYIFEADNKNLLLKSELKNCYVGFSEKTTGIENLYTAYLHAVLMRKNAFAKQSKVVDWTEGYEVPEMTELSSSGVSQIDSVVLLLGTERIQEAANLLDKLVQEVIKDETTIYYFEAVMDYFIEKVAKHYQQVLKVSKDDLVLLKKMYQHQTITDYQKMLIEWTLKFHELISEELDDYKNKQKIQEALFYIQENFNKDLNMAVVSNQISMNYSLFSYVFKQYTGTNFVSYLKELRVNEAKRLLKETDLRVIEISAQVGYENEKHFMKTFKQICGVSPSEYRKSVK